MIRIAFRMTVHPGQAQEYERRHNPIWEELRDTLLDHGVRSYSIFLDPGTNDLFAYAEIDSEERWAAIASTEVCRRWWRTMRDVMPSRSDGSPISRSLREVFHLEAPAASTGPVEAGLQASTKAQGALSDAEGQRRGLQGRVD